MANHSRELQILESVVKTMDLAILARSSGTNFQALGPVPDWFGQTFGSAETLCERSPFIEDFVQGAAEDCWQGDESSVESGYWEESGSNGRPHFFEAIATKQNGEDILIIDLVDDRHRQKQIYIQHAHNNALHQRKLAKERERKEILLDCIVHDLSSPLSTILMNIQHVESQLQRSDLRQALQRAELQANRQRELIHSISHTFNSELSAFEPALLSRGEGVDVTNLAVDMMEAFQLAADQKNLHLEFHRGSDEPARAIAEKSHLSRILDNLFNYAIHRSKEGEAVSLHIKQTDGKVRVSVKDSAPAIAASSEDLFDHPFQNQFNGKSLETDSESPHASTGQFSLGLYFCKMTIELWGGKIGYEPMAQGGNCFWFELKQSASLAAQS